MRRWFLFIAIAATFLTANGFYLWFFESRAVSSDYVLSYYYIWNVLAHLAVGLLFAIPFIGFVISHLQVTWKHRNRRSRIVGLMLAGAAALSLGTGIWLMVFGAVRANQWILVVHIAVAMAGVLLFSLHRWASSRATRLTLANLKEVGIIVSVFIALSAGHIISQSGVLHKAEAAPQPISFFPSRATIADNKFIPAEELSNVQYCKECHPDAYAQWKSSAHAHSSFDNPFYSRSVDYLEQTSDPNRVRWCAACHDPAILFSGQMQNVAKGADFRKNPFASASITCITCHAMRQAPITGNSGYVIAPPVQYPFAYSNNPILHALNHLLIYVKPEPHREAFMKPFHRTSLFCAECHKVHIPEAVNDYKWQRGQDEYDAWDNSGVSWHSVRSFYRPPKPFTKCAQCHMPLVQSNDPGNVNGLVHFHSFPAANTALAYVNNDTAWLTRTIAFLQAKRMRIDVFAIKRGNQIVAPLNRSNVDVVPGETAQLDVVVRNLSVGHAFPGGTIDAQQPWVEFIGRDAAGNEFFHNGWENPRNQHVDSTAHFYHSRIFSRAGDLIMTRGVNLWVATLYKHVVGSGSADVVHYKVHIPAAVQGPVVFVAKLHYKKFDEAFSELVFQSQRMPEFPDVIMAADSVAIPTGAAPLPGTAARALPPSDRDRFNDYGIGLWLENDQKGADWAWRNTTEIDPTFADGFINLARIDMSEGYLARADTDLTYADHAQPGYYKTTFFRGELDKDLGKYDTALAELTSVHNGYPFDRVTIDEIGRIHYLIGAENNDAAQYQRAIQWYEKELAIDPEDKTPYYNMMLCYRALGDNAQAARSEAAWRKYKDDEFQPEVTRRYRQEHPAANEEAQPLHIHEDSRYLMNF